SSSSSPLPSTTPFRSGDFLRQQQLSLAILSIAAAGLAVIAILTTGLLANLLSERRKSLTVIARSRGASTGQLLTAQALEALALRSEEPTSELQSREKF